MLPTRYTSIRDKAGQSRGFFPKRIGNVERNTRLLNSRTFDRSTHFFQNSWSRLANNCKHLLRLVKFDKTNITSKLVSHWDSNWKIGAKKSWNDIQALRHVVWNCSCRTQTRFSLGHSRPSPSSPERYSLARSTHEVAGVHSDQTYLYTFWDIAEFEFNFSQIV